MARLPRREFQGGVSGKELLSEAFVFGFPIKLGISTNEETFCLADKEEFREVLLTLPLGVEMKIFFARPSRQKKRKKG
jgi:hypothetical protein